MLFDAESLGKLGGDGTGEVLRFLAEKKVLLDGGDRYHWIADAYPAQQVGLRTIGAENFVVVDRSRDVVLGEIDFRGAHTMVHEQAVYQHAGETYQVERLVYENRKAFVAPVDFDYYTYAQTYSRDTVLEREAEAKAAMGRVDLGWGEVRVVERVVGYKKIKFHTHENVGWGDVHLPELEMHTNGTWWTVPAGLAETFGLSRPAMVDALHGLGYALRHVGALKLLCDPRDVVANLSETVEGEVEAVTLTLYEAYPGGVGLVEELFHLRDALLADAEHLVGGCGCRGGCPSCTGPAEEPSSDRRAGVRLPVPALRETDPSAVPTVPSAANEVRFDHNSTGLWYETSAGCRIVPPRRLDGEQYFATGPDVRLAKWSSAWTAPTSFPLVTALLRHWRHVLGHHSRVVTVVAVQKQPLHSAAAASRPAAIPAGSGTTPRSRALRAGASASSVRHVCFCTALKNRVHGHRPVRASAAFGHRPGYSSTAFPSLILLPQRSSQRTQRLVV